MTSGGREKIDEVGQGVEGEDESNDPLCQDVSLP